MANWLQIVLLLASGQGILLSLALLTPSSKKDKSNIFLGLIILIFSLELLNAWGMQVRYHQLAHAFPFWLLGSYLVVPPSIWLFVQYNTQPGFRFKRKYLLLYVPALVEIVAETFTFIHYRTTGNASQLQRNIVWYYFTEVIPILWTAWVLVVYNRSLRKIREQPMLRTQRFKLYGLFIFFLLLLTCWAGEVFLQLPIFTVVEMLLVLFLFSLGYIGYFRPAFFEAPEAPRKKTTAVPAFTNYKDDAELARLQEVMVSSALYTRSGLTLEELAAELKLPPRYVSYLVNNYHKTNFHSYINSFRVKEVLRKLSDPEEQHKTLLALAYEAGFNSKSSFNQVFKDHVGETPSAYLKRMGPKVR